MEDLVTTKIVSAALLTDGDFFPDCGALVTFEGKVRNHDHGKSVLKLHYQAYPRMAQSELKKIKSEIEASSNEIKVFLVHRVGELMVGEVAVAIAVWAPHRKEAFRACEFAIDEIKKRVPIWKKEYYVGGETQWVACHHH